MKSCKRKVGELQVACEPHFAHCCNIISIAFVVCTYAVSREY